jgi:hypothetical protein
MKDEAPPPLLLGAISVPLREAVCKESSKEA